MASWRATYFPKEASLSDDMAKQLEAVFWKSRDDETQLRGVVSGHVHQLGRHTILPESVHVVCIVCGTAVESRGCQASASTGQCPHPLSDMPKD